MYNVAGATGIRAQRYSATGLRIGAEILVDEQLAYTGGLYYFFERLDEAPAVAINDRGAFVITWLRGDDITGRSVAVAKRFSALGAPVGSRFQVSGPGGTKTVIAPGTIQYNSYPKYAPEVAIDAAGNFLIGWAGTTPEALDGVNARRYAADGTATAPEFLVNTPDHPNSTAPSLAMDADGRALFVWTQGSSVRYPGMVYNSYQPYGSIMARRFDSAGAPVGPEFRVNTTSQDVLRDAAATRSGSGGAVGELDLVGRRFEGFCRIRWHALHRNVLRFAVIVPNAPRRVSAVA